MGLLVLIVITCGIIAILLVRLAGSENRQLTALHDGSDQEALILAAIKDANAHGLFHALCFGSLPSKEATITRVLAWAVILFVLLFFLLIVYVFVARS